jgi:hypothetical protein
VKNRFHPNLLLQIQRVPLQSGGSPTADEDDSGDAESLSEWAANSNSAPTPSAGSLGGSLCGFERLPLESVMTPDDELVLRDTAAAWGWGGEEAGGAVRESSQARPSERTKAIAAAAAAAEAVARAAVRRASSAAAANSPSSSSSSYAFGAAAASAYTPGSSGAATPSGGGGNSSKSRFTPPHPAPAGHVGHGGAPVSQYAKGFPSPGEATQSWSGKRSSLVELTPAQQDIVVWMLALGMDIPAAHVLRSGEIVALPTVGLSTSLNSVDP